MFPMCLGSLRPLRDTLAYFGLALLSNRAKSKPQATPRQGKGCLKRGSGELLIARFEHHAELSAGHDICFRIMRRASRVE